MKKIMIVIFFFTAVFYSNILTQIDENNYFNFLQKSYTSKTDNDNEFLIKQYNMFLNSFPNSPKGDEVLYYLGQLYLEERDYFDALSCFAKISFLYPNSSRTKDNKVAYTQIVMDHESRSFEDIYTEFLNKLNENKPHQDFLVSYFNYLFFIRETNLEDLNDVLISDINFYMQHFPSKIQNSDQLLLWLAEIYENKRDWSEAVLIYKKLIEIFPTSSMVPQALFKTGYLEYEEKSNPQIAKEIFVQLITDYGESEFAGDAQFFLSELYEKELDNTNEAITNYRLVVETYPANKYAVESLKRVAEILEKQDKYEEAIASYYQIVELYPQHPFAPEALIEIKTLYVRRLENYEKAIETLKFYAKQYPDREDAAELLFDAAEIYEDDLQNNQAAIDTYHQVINDFPNSDYAGRAKDRIDSLSEK
ncbi:tetratricopeptide repeat protein [Calditrichota bacterium]